MSEQIKIIELIKDVHGDCYKAVINKGINDSIKKGQKFLIVGIGKELFDPDTNESLGKLEIVRGVAVATHVQEKITTVESQNYKKEFPTKTVEETSGSAAIIFGGLGRTKRTTYEEKENTLLPFDNIEIGDIAKNLEE